MTEEVLKIIVQFEKSPATPEKKALQCELEYFAKTYGDSPTNTELLNFGKILADDFPAEFAKIKTNLDYDFVIKAILSKEHDALTRSFLDVRYQLVAAIKDFAQDQLELIELEKTA